jgi:hypothetical protein
MQAELSEELDTPQQLQHRLHVSGVLLDFPEFCGVRAHMYLWLCFSP